MNKEEILAMEAGRELDELVATKLMGAPDEIIVTDTELYPHVSPYTHNKEGFIVGWHPSTDISAAWDMEETLYTKLPEMGTRYANELIHLMDIGYNRTLSNLARLIRATPEQRCKAALLALIDS